MQQQQHCRGHVRLLAQLHHDIKKIHRIIFEGWLIQFLCADIRFLFNLKNSDCKYFAFNNYESVKINKDIPTGQHRKINVLNKPFNFETPNFKILELLNSRI